MKASAYPFHQNGVLAGIKNRQQSDAYCAHARAELKRIRRKRMWMHIKRFLHLG